MFVVGKHYDDTFPLAKFCVIGYSTPYRLDRTCKGGGLLLHVKDDIPSKQIKLKFMKMELSKDFLLKLISEKNGFFATLIIQMKITFCLTYMLLATL